MSWFKNDDGLHAHRKTRKAGLEAMGLWVVAGSWSANQLTDGFIPVWFVDGWPRGRTLARRLQAAGFWLPAQDGEPGWRFHDWLDYNPSAEDEKSRRRRAAERQRRSRAAYVTRDIPRDELRQSRRQSQYPDPARPLESLSRGEKVTVPEARAIPPSYSDHCEEHWFVAEPGPCGPCKDARLASVPAGYCIVHDQRYWSECSGCAADRKALGDLP